MSQSIVSHVNSLFESYRIAFVKLFSIVSLEDVEKCIGEHDKDVKERIKKHNTEESTEESTKISSEYQRVKKIYDDKKDSFCLTDMSEKLFNELSKMSMNSKLRSKIEAIYLEAAQKTEDKKVKANEPAQTGPSFKDSPDVITKAGLFCSPSVKTVTKQANLNNESNDEIIQQLSYN